MVLPYEHDGAFRIFQGVHQHFFSRKIQVIVGSSSSGLQIHV
jgi:hypothetical protein